MNDSPKNWIIILAICSFVPEAVVSYGHKGLQQIPINQFGTQSIPSVASLPLANNYQVYRVPQNIVRSPLPLVHNNVFQASSLQSGQLPYTAPQGQFVNSNYGTGIRTTSIPSNVWSPNRIPVASNVPVYQQSSVPPAFTPYPGQFQTLQSNAPLVHYSGLGSGFQHNNAALPKPGIQHQLLTPLNNQFTAGSYNIQRQPVVTQFGSNVNNIRNPNQQLLNNVQQSNQLPASTYNVYQENPLFLRHNNALRNSSPSLLQQAKLQQAQLHQLKLQQLQLQQSLLLTQKRLQQQQSSGTLSFRPSPQLPSGTVLDGSNTVSTFVPLNLNTAIVDNPTQEWNALSENEEVKAEDSVKNTIEATKKPKGKALTQPEPEVKSASKVSSAKKVTTAAPKTKTSATKKPNTTTTTTKTPTVSPKAETGNTANIVAETIEAPRVEASEIDPGVLSEASNSGASEPLVIADKAVDEAPKTSQLIESKEPDTSDIPSEPLVLAVAEPAFLELIKESS